MGVIIAPVVGSGSIPAWMAFVANFMGAKVANVTRVETRFLWLTKRVSTATADRPRYTKSVCQPLRIQ